jgi:hypothetical protein
MSLTLNNSFNLEGRTPMEQITGKTPDISEYLDLGFYDWVSYKDNAGIGDNKIGRWLDVSHRVGNLMSYWILTVTGHELSQTTVQHITNLELSTDEIKSNCKDFDQSMAERLNDVNHVIPEDGDLQLQDWNEFPVEEDPDFVAEFQNVVSDPMVPKEDETFTPNVFDDIYLNMEIALP